ncbi:hypothetical protein [Parvibaculum sp.]|uniref:hypothetical protein n=1 Tax=Parvibaculum sp. TaxID=2024848 RepID=UPI0032976711
MADAMRPHEVLQALLAVDIGIHGDGKTLKNLWAPLRMEGWSSDGFASAFAASQQQVMVAGNVRGGIPLRCTAVLRLRFWQIEALRCLKKLRYANKLGENIFCCTAQEILNFGLDLCAAQCHLVHRGIG